MPERIDEGRNISDVVAPRIDTFVKPMKEGKSHLATIAEALGTIDPAAKALAKQNITGKAQAEVTEGTNEAKNILATEAPSKDLEDTMKLWQKAGNENKIIMGLNPFAQAKARQDIARASAGALEPELEAMVNRLSSDISIDDDFGNIKSAISALRQETLEDLNIVDPNEIGAFNSKFNQMEQNFTARFNAKAAQLREGAALERFDGEVGDTFSKSMDILGNYREGAAETVGAHISEEIRSQEVSGLLRKDKRNSVVATSTEAGLIRDHWKNGNGRRLVDDGLLENVKMSIGDGKEFSLGQYQGGRYKEELIQKLNAIDAQKASIQEQAQVQARKDLTVGYTGAVHDLVKLPPIDQAQALEQLNAEFGGPEQIALMGADWKSKMSSVMNAERNNVAQNVKGGFDASLRSPRFEEEWRTALSDYRADYTDYLTDAASQWERKEINDHEYQEVKNYVAYRDELHEDLSITPARKGFMDKMEAVLHNIDFRQDTIMQDFMRGIGGSAITDPQVQDAIFQLKNRANGIIGEMSTTTDPEGRLALQNELDALANSAADTVFGTQEFLDFKRDEGQAAVAERVNQLIKHPQRSTNEWERLPLPERYKVLDSWYSPETLQTDFGLPKDIAEQVHGIYLRDIRNRPEILAPQTFGSDQNLGVFKALGGILKSYKATIGSLDEADAASTARGDDLIGDVKRRANMLGALASVKNSLADLNKLAADSTANDFALNLTSAEAPRRSSSLDRAAEGVVQTKSSAAAHALYANEYFTQSAIEMGQVDIALYSDDITTLNAFPIAQGQFVEALLNTDENVLQQGASGQSYWKPRAPEQPMRGSTAHLGKFITKHNLEKYIILSPDGTTFSIPTTPVRRGVFTNAFYDVPLNITTKFQRTMIDKTQQEVKAHAKQDTADDKARDRAAGVAGDQLRDKLDSRDAKATRE